MHCITALILFKCYTMNTLSKYVFKIHSSKYIYLNSITFQPDIHLNLLSNLFFLNIALIHILIDVYLIYILFLTILCYFYFKQYF